MNEFDIPNWDSPLTCYDCGKPAFYEATQIYGSAETDIAERAFCPVCAAFNVAIGNGPIRFLYPED